jgi:hypothetical protein
MAHFSMFRLLSLAFDLMFLSSLAILILGSAENEFVFLPITFALSGIIVQAILLEVTSQAGIQDLQLQTERWRAATNAKL